MHLDQRHELAAVLHHELIVRDLDLAHVDLFESRHQGQRHRFRRLADRAVFQRVTAVIAGKRYGLHRVGSGSGCLLQPRQAVER